MYTSIVNILYKKWHPHRLSNNETALVSNKVFYFLEQVGYIYKL